MLEWKKCQMPELDCKVCYMDCKVVQICENRSHVTTEMFSAPENLKVLTRAPLTFQKAKEGWSRRLRGQMAEIPPRCWVPVEACSPCPVTGSVP